MRKSGIFLAMVGGLIGIGIILSFYGNYLLFEDLVQGNGMVGEGKDLIIEVELDNKVSKTGIYAIQILDFKGGSVIVSIIDPFNTIIETESIGEETFEGILDVASPGIYKLLIESNGEPQNIFGVIGSEPDQSKRALSNVSMYILVIGLLGTAGMAVYMFIERRKSN